MMTRHFRKVAIIAAILAIFLAACASVEETPEPTEVVQVEEQSADDEAADDDAADDDAADDDAADDDAADDDAADDDAADDDAADDDAADDDAADDDAADDDAADDDAADDDAADDDAADDDAADDDAADEESMDDEDMDDEESMDDEDMDDEESMDDEDMEVATVPYDNGAGFTFEYPEGYEATEGANSVNLRMGDQQLAVIDPIQWDLVFGTADAEGTEENLTFFVDRLGYETGETADMMMVAASINIELPRRNQIGFANLVDLGDGNFGVVLELGPDADNVPSADGAVISDSMAYTPPPPPEEEAPAEEEAAEEEESEEEDSEESEDAESEETGDDEESEESMDMEEEPTLTIVGLALGADNLNTLVVAVQRGGFLSTLNGEGPFTVFAPTDEAFAVALDALGLTADELLGDEELLGSVLTYHVVEGAVLSTDLEDGMEVETLNGAILTVNVSDDGVTLTDGTGATYNVVAADVMASNGVVHVIDGVLLPPSE